MTGEGGGQINTPPQMSEGRGPDQIRTLTEGNAYLQKYFPKLDYIKSGVVVEKAKK